MNRNNHAIVWAAAVLAGFSAVASGQVSTGSHLYTEPSPSACGGIKGLVKTPAQALVAAYALPPDEPRFVYKGTVAGSEKQEFSFSGLPPGKYDLLLVFADCFYEGLTLSRPAGKVSLTDRESIEKIIRKTEPYYTTKKVHRIDGQGGTGGVARCICTFLRDKESVGFMDGKVYPDHRRSLKLVLLEEVGPGWQVVRTREIHTAMVTPGVGPLAHFTRKNIGGIRVTDAVRDLGAINLETSGGN